MWRLSVVLLLICLFADHAYSNTPPPSGGERSQPQKQSANPQQGTSPNQYGTEQSPVFIKVLPTKESDAKAAKDADERDQKAELDRKLVEFNGDLAYYTKILAIVAGLQFLALIGQIVFMRLAFKEGRRAADVARDAMIAGERAFIFAVSVTGQWTRTNKTGPYFWYLCPIWQNSGSTPTRNMTMRTTCVLKTEPLPKGFNFDDPTAVTGTALIPPKITVFGGRAPDPPLSPQDILEVIAGKKILYLWGWARYHDVFPDTPQHITRFCWTIYPQGDPTTFTEERPDSLKWLSILHSEGNCADEECNQ